MQALEEFIEGSDRSPEAVVGEHQERRLLNVLPVQVECCFPAAEVLPLVAPDQDRGTALAQTMQRSRVPTQPAGRRHNNHIGEALVGINQGKEVVPKPVVG